MGAEVTDRVLGIDLDTHKLSLVTVSRAGFPVDRTTIHAGDRGTAATRFPVLLEAFDRWLGLQVKPVVPYVEDVPFIKNRHGFAGLAQVLGAVRVVCQLRGYPPVVIAGSQWKKTVGLPGNAAKPKIATWVDERTSRLRAAELETQDLKDAYAIACAGLILEGD